MFLTLILAFVADVALGFALSMPSAWLVMLILGAFHATYFAVPALSFGLTWLGVFACSLLFHTRSTVTTK